MKTILLSIVIVVLGLSSKAIANTGSILRPDDFIGFSFWFTALSCLAATSFFLFERNSVASGWRILMTVSGLITGISFIQFIFLINLWITISDVPIVYKYIEWLITMPLLLTQFYLVLSSTRKVPPRIFWKFLASSLLMVLGGYAGEAGYILPLLGLILWSAAWLYILYELFSGEIAIIISRSSNELLVLTYQRMRVIVTFGWTIYPLAYVFGYMTGAIDSNYVNVIYNLGDFVNKIAFGVVIWIAAKQ